MLETGLLVEIEEVLGRMTINNSRSPEFMGMTNYLRRLEIKRKLPEFMNRARYIEGRLQEGESLIPEIGVLGSSGKAGPGVETMVLNLYGREEEPVKALALGSSGMMEWDESLFTDYKPPSET